jgi:hypothetical protein
MQSENPRGKRQREASIVGRSKRTNQPVQHGQATLALSCDERKGGEETLHIG